MLGRQSGRRPVCRPEGLRCNRRLWSDAPRRRPPPVHPRFTLCFTVFRVGEVHKTLCFTGFIAHTERRRGKAGDMRKRCVFLRWCRGIPLQGRERLQFPRPASAPQCGRRNARCGHAATAPVTPPRRLRNPKRVHLPASKLSRGIGRPLPVAVGLQKAQNCGSSAAPRSWARGRTRGAWCIAPLAVAPPRPPESLALKLQLLPPPAADPPRPRGFDLRPLCFTVDPACDVQKTLCFTGFCVGW